MKLSSPKLTVFALACAATLCACTSKMHSGITSHNGVITMNASAVKSDSSLSQQQKAEQLALMGEQLFTLTNFMYAEELFDQALAIDSTNLRAQFYKNLGATLMTLKGMMVRIQPMIRTAQSRADYQKTLAHFPHSALRTFLFDGKPDIKSMKDIQAYEDSLIAAQEQWRQFLRSNKNITLTLNLNDWFKPLGVGQTVSDCRVTKPNQETYDLTNCDMTHAVQEYVNRADVEALQQIAAGMEIYLGSIDTYDLTGLIRTSDKFQNQNPPAPVVWNELTKYPRFGTLRTPIYLKRVVSMGVDAIAGVRWAKSLQSQLCPTGQSGNMLNRQNYLFAGGLCVPNKTSDGQSVDKLLKTAELILSGVPYEVTINNTYRTQITPTAFLNSPIQDVKALYPTFNSCGEVQTVSDSTLGGIFPNHDANQVLSVSSQCANQYSN